MSVIATGDLHLTTNPQDEYRWGIFDWLCEQRQKHADELILLGDYTNPKDNHPAALVNRLKECIYKCARHFNTVIMIAGNHDYIDPDCPFFMFLDDNEKVLFIKEWDIIETSIGLCCFVPASTDWSKLEPGDAEYIFTHATFDGAISETGHRLSGIAPSIASGMGIPIISGDIHKPQTIGKWIEYVGAPYHTRFGSDYNPHILHIDDDHVRTYLHYPAPRKNTYVIKSLEDLDKLKIDDSDHIKIRVNLSRGELTEWAKIQEEIKTRAKDQGWVMTAPELILDQKPSENQNARDLTEVKTPEQLIEDYAKKHNASEEHVKVGKALL